MASTTIGQSAAVRDVRAARALPDSSAEVGQLWRSVTDMTAQDLPPMGLAAGERPTADVEVLAGALAAVEYEVARRMHAAATNGALPLAGPGALLAARGWAPGPSRRLARAGALAAEHPTLAAAWGAGLITAEHVDAVARHAQPFSADELAAVIAELDDHWGRWSPAAVARFVAAAARMLHPPGDEPTPDEQDAHESRNLSFAILGDTVLLSGTLPRLEGEAVMAAIEAWSEKLRSTAEHVPAGARRADALVALVNNAAATGALPTRGGLPVALSVTLEHTSAGDPVWTTSRGHHLTASEAQFVACDPTLTPIAVTNRHPARADMPHAHPGAGPGSDPGAGPGSDPRSDPAARIAALAHLMLAGPRSPLAVGRTTRIATPAQRRALAARDGGCIIPGCQVPAENCQTHHVREWSTGGRSDLENLALLCWAHHRQVDLGMWAITPAPPDEPAPEPDPGAPPGTPWPGNNGAPWIISATTRLRWRRR